MNSILILQGHPTKEITLKDFNKIWEQGGFCCSGNQFSNADSHSYLWTIDLQKTTEIAQEKEQFQEWLERVPRTSTIAPSGDLWVEPTNPEDRQKKSDWEWRLRNLSAVIDNITDDMSVGWVVGVKHRTQRNHREQPTPLPEQWNEVYAEFYKYGRGFIDKQLVARNNHDGTVQVFKPIFK